MAAYKYRALDSDGKLIKGVLEGDSERQIRAQLRTKSLRPIEVDFGRATRSPTVHALTQGQNEDGLPPD